jgi:hypothetical protein
VRLDDGRPITPAIIRYIIGQETAKLSGGRIAEAVAIFERMTTGADFAEFLTPLAYDYID